MCGRYAASRRPEDLVEEFEIDEEATDLTGSTGPVQRLEPSWNVAPTDAVYAVLERVPRSDRAQTAESATAPVRRLQPVRWGLVPSWAKDASIGARMINARVETVSEKPAYKKAFASRRCLLPADGYFEWYGETRAKKQPYFITRGDGRPLAMAGLYELWRDRSKADDDPDRWLWTCTVITTTAEDDLGRIHDRMPMIVEREQYGAWLDPSVHDPERLQGLLVPAAPGLLTAYAVSTEVNNVRNDGPQLVERVQLDDAVPSKDLRSADVSAEVSADQEALF